MRPVLLTGLLLVAGCEGGAVATAPIAMPPAPLGPTEPPAPRIAATVAVAPGAASSVLRAVPAVPVEPARRLRYGAAAAPSPAEVEQDFQRDIEAALEQFPPAAERQTPDPFE